MGFDEWLAHDPAQGDKLCEACDEGKQRVGFQHYANYWCCNKCYESLQDIWGECDTCGVRYELSDREDHCPECGLCYGCDPDHTPENPRTTLESVPDKVRELRALADKMWHDNSPYAVEVHAIAFDLTQGLGLDKESK